MKSWTRRSLLTHATAGLGVAALSQLLAREGVMAAPSENLDGGIHHRAKAKRVIQLFMNGGASQMDLFDYKPELSRRDGQTFDPGNGERVEAATSEPGKVLASPFAFSQHGETGRWVSDRLPHLAKKVDDLAFFMAMTSRTNVHGPASYLMNTGFLLPGFPCLGSWTSYALGSLTDSLPTFVVMPDPKGLPYNQRGNFSAGFLPVSHQGTTVQSGAGEPIADLHAPASASFINADSERDGLGLLESLNRSRGEDMEDSRWEARIAAYQLAAKMQLQAPEAFDLTRESASTRTLYGLEDAATADFGRRCLLARRLLERGVRFIQIWSGAGGPKGNWDNHTSIIDELPPMALATDRPIAGLLTDLQSRGLLDDTLVLWNTEFGRMPFAQGGKGRDHNGGAFVGWMAGAGVRAGATVGQTDEWGWKSVHQATTTYDFHATVLHLLGINHEKLSVRHNGADRRLTDVHGHVVKEVLAN